METFVTCVFLYMCVMHVFAGSYTFVSKIYQDLFFYYVLKPILYLKYIYFLNLLGVQVALSCRPNAAYSVKI